MNGLPKCWGLDRHYNIVKCGTKYYNQIITNK